MGAGCLPVTILQHPFLMDRGFQLLVALLLHASIMLIVLSMPLCTIVVTILPTHSMVPLLPPKALPHGMPSLAEYMMIYSFIIWTLMSSTPTMASVLLAKFLLFLFVLIMVETKTVMSQSRRSLLMFLTFKSHKQTLFPLFVRVSFFSVFFDGLFDEAFDELS